MRRHSKLLFILIFFCVLNGLQAQNSDHTEETKGIQIGHIDRFYSEILQEEHRVWIHLPSEYTNHTEKPDRIYPVLFILDASSHFTAMAAMADQLGKELFWPKMIIVGIESSNRYRDYTPSKIHRLDDLPPEYFNHTGGAAVFLEFLTKELIPYIEGRYPAAPYRSLLGHSLGGLFTTYAMYTGTDVFRNFIALDPSVWWDQNYLLNQLSAYRKCLLSEKSNFYLVAANSLPEGITPENVHTTSGNRTAHFKAIKKLDDLMYQMRCDDENYTFQYHESNSHANIGLPGYYEAISSIFDFYNIDPVLRSFDPEILHNISTERFLAAFKDHYATISEELGFVILPEEDLISDMGYKSLELEDYEKAEALFKLNITNFPESSRVYDGMGDFYFSINQLYKAERFYEKAHSFGSDDRSKTKLRFLKSKQ